MSEELAEVVEAKTLAEALLNLQAEVPTLPKDAENPHFKSKFTPLDTIVEVVGPFLVKHRLVWTALPGRDSTGEPALHYKLMHVDSGEELSGEIPLMLVKDDPQSQGSALTYARRYSISAVLNLVSDEDDDGNRAQSNGSERKGKMGFTKPAQRNLFEAKVRAAGATPAVTGLIASYANANFEGHRNGGISKAIDKLQGDEAKETLEKLTKLAKAWEAEQSDIPADEEGLPQEGEEAPATL